MRRIAPSWVRDFTIPSSWFCARSSVGEHFGSNADACLYDTTWKVSHRSDQSDFSHSDGEEVLDPIATRERVGCGDLKITLALIYFKFNADITSAELL